ncbi:MAG: SGNH/GDSL hydrolase family protein [Clostridia bacterium]|nr:SGNH/GDSL hydrolase family protein [Clostridia bacterium]
MFDLGLIPDPNEKPLDNLAVDGGFCGIFRRICVVGDSLSSGEFEGPKADGSKSYHDFIEDYSWGKYLARACGSDAFVFSRGGMTAKEYCESFAEANGFWDKDKACQCYIIALGVNDVFNRKMPIGSLSDICPEDYTKNADTFAGWYARIIQRYKEIQPDAKFFFVTTPRGGGDAERIRLGDEMAELLRSFAKYFENSYVIDLHEYAPEYTGELRHAIYLGGHLTPTGYIMTAKMIGSYIDYIIRHNPDDFRQVGFIGTPYKNTAWK